MHKIKHYIDLIVENGDTEYMECLSDMLCDVIYLLKDEHYEQYKKYKNKLKGMAYDFQIDEELAKEIVTDFEPYGEYWDKNAIANVIGNDTHRLCDMYVVMNSLVNDYSSVVSVDNVDTYIKMAHAWLDDVDGHDHKVWWYFVK